jgi:hypothetical protein
MKLVLLLFLHFFALVAIAQNTGTIQGNAKDVNTEEPLAFAKVFIEGTQIGALTDIDGNYKIEVAVGTYTIVITAAGYDPLKKFNIPVNSGNVETVNFELASISIDLEAVEIVYDRNQVAQTTDMITPLSVQKLTSVEIESNPGGNFDVSKVLEVRLVGRSETTSSSEVEHRTKMCTIWTELKFQF